ncbi:hypothetical protein NE237_032796 [Protea cynaroides]|uniref:X8 domain-containing protein n=1 Tax=Protea cynaroides TaxID=273540 RepID=A0A9Q0R3Q9_9MAGN|nr:hypothetical protein NE237_032796 [Protea cynaroides]
MGRINFCAAPLFLLLLSTSSLVVMVVESAIGVNWGTISSDRLAPSIVVNLLKENNITKVKLFDVDPQALSALRGTDIEVMVGIENQMLSILSTSPDVADSWITQNVSTYMTKGGVNIRYIAVGNEPFLTSFEGKLQTLVVPSLLNLQKALEKANLANLIKLVVPCNADAYESTVPSEGAFRPELTQIMTDLASFLNSTGSPFLVNIYPFLSLYQNSDFPQDFAFFNGTTHPLTDGPNVYSNAFDGNLDTLAAALDKVGYGQLPIVVGEIGWPTDGAPNANLNAASAFNQGLINHILSNKGTPMRPGVPPMDVYLFGLLDENAKSVLPGNFERHWGIFSFDGQAKYPLKLGLDSGPLKNATDVQHLPSSWCVVNPSKDISLMSKQFEFACSTVADCTALEDGGSCSGIGGKGNISYAFNGYYQQQKQDPRSCDFDGFGMITNVDPSVGDCRFPVGISVKSTFSPIKIEDKSSGSPSRGNNLGFRIRLDYFASWVVLLWVSLFL